MSPGPVEFGLHVAFGDRWHPPTADYSCPCGYTDAAEGKDAVARFANTAARIHRAECPLRQDRAG